MKSAKKQLVEKFYRSNIGLSRRKIELIVDDVARQIRERGENDGIRD